MNANTTMTPLSNREQIEEEFGGFTMNFDEDHVAGDNASEKRNAALPTASITLDPALQCRVKTDGGKVREYAELMKAGVAFPPVDVFTDGATYWLSDGFHRFSATERLGRTDVSVKVHQGTKRDAMLFAVEANSHHGLPRSRADKRLCVERLLADPEWQQWSDREIARRSGVDHKTVKSIRDGYLGNSPDRNKRKVNRGGTEYTVKTANIGKTAASKAKAAKPVFSIQGGPDGRPDWKAISDIQNYLLLADKAARRLPQNEATRAVHKARLLFDRQYPCETIAAGIRESRISVAA